MNTSRPLEKASNEIKGALITPKTELPAPRWQKQRYFFSRIEGVKVIPTNNPSGVKKRLTV